MMVKIIFPLCFFFIADKFAKKMVSFSRTPSSQPIIENSKLCSFNTYDHSIKMLATYSVALSVVKINLQTIGTSQRAALLNQIKASSSQSLTHLVAIDFGSPDFPDSMPTDFPNLEMLILSHCDIKFELLKEFKKLRTVRILLAPEFYSVANPKFKIPALKSLTLCLAVGDILPTEPEKLRIDIHNVRELEIRVPSEIQKSEHPNDPNLSKFVKQLNDKNAPNLQSLILFGFGPQYKPDIVNGFIRVLCATKIDFIHLNLNKWKESERTAIKYLMCLAKDEYQVACSQYKANIVEAAAQKPPSVTT